MSRSRFLLPVLLACASLTVMAGATIAPGLPGLLEHFSDHPDAEYLTRFIITVPGLAIAITAPIAGCLADRLGRRTLLQAGVALYIVAGSAGLWLDDLSLLLWSRLLLGGAVGMIMVCSMALLTDHFQGAERDRAMGIQSSAMSAGGIIFISAGSILADWSWRAPFAVYLVPILLFPLIYKYVSKPPENQDEPGAMDGHFPVRHALYIYSLGFITMLLFYVVPTQLPFYAIELGADSLKYAGFAVVLSQVFSSVASANYQRLRKVLGNQEILFSSFLCMAVGFYLLSQASTLTQLYLSMPLIGLGLGFNFPNLTIWLMSQVPSTMRGRASGGISTAVFLGQFLSPLLSQPLVVRFGLEGAFFGVMLLMLLFVVVPSGLLLWREHSLSR
ncbi:MFS transporter [Granulosicoccus antarcticus]|uniref:Bacillibactin exporter n=1 Tax=Granulosicoccus antarcticus IMCC3135 TaxID=1192854 RepID=A0A2Z2P1N2_9GAMM|nr:MFS transporter [Granulosicoccus antarcticus]ASJ74377.1 Bacillibactin exporter [Granulosicoccus antarcticus IMCC3135]